MEVPLASPNPSLAEWVERICAGDPRAVSQALNFLDDERGGQAAARFQLLELLFQRKRSHGFTLGITGPPGVGKSTLTGGLVRELRRSGKSVGVLAVDPSSPVSGGALLGDRIRMQVEEDPGVFIRSLASRGHLGGLSEFCFLARVVMEAAFDRVIIETVGVGQSEQEILMASDLVLLVLQPQSGDTIQFLKAGVVEIPDLIVLNKMDLPGSEATLRELRHTLKKPLQGGLRATPPRILPCRASERVGVEEIAQAAEREILSLPREGRRLYQWRHWLVAEVQWEFGRLGIRLLGGEQRIASRYPRSQGESPFAVYLQLCEELNRSLKGGVPL